MSWCAMKQRCTNPNHRAYPVYGGRGITVCERWTRFSAFLADLGQPKRGETLDRIDNAKGYAPGNCRWASRSEQQNNRRVNVLVTYKGKTLNLMQWSKLTGIHRNTLDQRRLAGMTGSRLFSKKKFHDTSGLALGGLANGARIRARTHCKWGHPFDEKNTHTDAKGNRVCRACKNDREKARNAAKRALLVDRCVFG